MENKTKLAIAGLLLASVIGGYIYTGGGVVKFTVIGDSVWLTKKQYEEVKVEIITKYETDNLSYQGLQVLAAVLDIEAKKGKFKDILNMDLNKIIQRAK